MVLEVVLHGADIHIQGGLEVVLRAVLEAAHNQVVDDRSQAVVDHSHVEAVHEDRAEARSQEVVIRILEVVRSQVVARHILEVGSRVAHGLVVAHTQVADVHILAEALHNLAVAPHNLAVVGAHAVVDAHGAEVLVGEAPVAAAHTHLATLKVYHCYHHDPEAARSLRPEVAHTRDGVVEQGAAGYTPVVVDSNHLVEVEAVEVQKPDQAIDSSPSSDSVSLKALAVEGDSLEQVALLRCARHHYRCRLQARCHVLEAAHDAEVEHLGDRASLGEVAADLQQAPAEGLG